MGKVEDDVKIFNALGLTGSCKASNTGFFGDWPQMNVADNCENLWDTNFRWPSSTSAVAGWDTRNNVAKWCLEHFGWYKNDGTTVPSDRYCWNLNALEGYWDNDCTNAENEV